jgi:hypothetical protein
VLDAGRHHDQRIDGQAVSQGAPVRPFGGPGSGPQDHRQMDQNGPATAPHGPPPQPQSAVHPAAQPSHPGPGPAGPSHALGAPAPKPADAGKRQGLDHPAPPAAPSKPPTKDKRPANGLNRPENPG